MVKDTKKYLINLIIAMFFIMALLIAGCSSQNANPLPTNQVSPVQIIDGVQAVTLTWGKFNYEPAVIVVKSNMPVRITADLTRLQGCFRSFVIPDLGVYKNFNYNDDSVEFTPSKQGTFRFTCSMGMGSGKIVVE